MDKSKNRTDLLAAGRKKLQQFRKKKDHRESSSSSSSSSGHGISSSKASKHESESESDVYPEEEPTNLHSTQEKTDQDDPATATVLEHHQEAKRLDSQQGNDKSTTDEDVADSGVEIVQEMDGLSFLRAMSSEGVGGPSVSSETDNERDGRQSSGEESELVKGGPGMEDTEFAEEANPASNLKEQSSSHDISSTNCEDGAVSNDAQGERRTSEETGGPSALNEQLKASNEDTSDKPEETTLRESSAEAFSSHDFLATEKETSIAADVEGGGENDVYLQPERFQESNGSSTLDGVLEVEDTSHSALEGYPASQGGSGAVVANEEYLQQTVRTQEENNSSSVPSSNVFSEVNTSFSDMPEETTTIEEKIESVLPSPEDIIPAAYLLYGSIIADAEKERGTTAENKSFEKLPEKGFIPFEEKTEGIGKEDRQLVSYDSELESIRKLLYITTVEKAVLQLQLDEQIQLNTHNQLQSLDEVMKLSNLVKETQKSKEMVDEELKQCKSGLQALSIAKEELETQYVSMEGEMEELRISAIELQNRLEQSQEGFTCVLVELTDCRVSLEILQKENLELTEILHSEEHARKKLVEESELYSSVNKRLSSEVLEQREKLLSAFAKHAQFQSELRDTGVYIEQIAEENMHLSSSLEVHKEKMKELNGTWMALPSQAKESGSEKMLLLQKNGENQQSRLQESINDLSTKVSECKYKINYLQNHIDEMEQTANDEVTRLFRQIEMLQNELNDKASILKQDTDSIEAATVEAICKLNAATGLQMSEEFSVGSHVSASVNAAVFAIKSLNGKIEESRLHHHTLQTSFDELNRSFMDMQGRNQMMLALLKKIYRSLTKFVLDPYQNIEEAIMDADTDDTLQLLMGKSDILIGHLQKLVDGRNQLIYTNNELESSMLNKNYEIDELNVRCKSLSQQLESECRSREEIESNLMSRDATSEDLANGVLALTRKLEDYILSDNSDAASVFMKSDSMESDLSRLDALISLCLKKYEEVVEEINSSKNCVQEANIDPEISADNWSLPLPVLLRQEFVPKVTKLQEELQFLRALNLQQESEIHSLTEGLSKMEEAEKASRSELNLKVSELEQSEQRLSSVREKLSIAVSKGKGLIVQRDSLKQSLEEKTGELEKCMQELQSKETMLHEVEVKLKSYSDVDRVEALESELSYIRNSATALRDSFLLKDSVLQRIEEVLEDLDLPVHFHSKDIVEKIESLCRLVADNSYFPLTDTDQKSSEGALRSDIQPNPNPNEEADDLKRKFEELQSKYYGLAEHNDMLEQSLEERNRVVKKWEEMLDRIDMPSHLKSLEPEDRIESLGRALYDIQSDRDNLQQKIENLEDSSDMLITDLEDSHKKISELHAEIFTVRSEKDFFSESLKKLRFQYLALSEKADHDELERENLQRELADLQEKNVNKVEDKNQHCIEKEIQKLHDLVRHVLPDGDDSETNFGEDGIVSLDALLRKLIDNYTLLSSEKSENIVADKSDPSLKDEELLGLRSELEKVSQSLVLVKEERNAAVEKCLSLMLDIEEMTRQMNLLQEERSHDQEKYHSLGLELEAVSKQRDHLQEKLTEEEQKSASTREKLNVAVRKGKALVQQRDALKQTIEEMTASLECLKAEHNQRVESLESENSSLMNQLTETEQNFQEKSKRLSGLLTAIHSIEIGSEFNSIDPVQKMEEIEKHSRNLYSALVSSEQEAMKSKQAAELLLTELNEVQDRADILQEELEKVQAALLESNKQKHDAEVSKFDALSSLEKLTSVHSEERKMQVENVMELKAGMDQLGKGCNEFSSLVSSVFEKNAELLSYVHSFLESILKQINGEEVVNLPVLGSSILSSHPIIKENSLTVADVWQHKMDPHSDDSSVAEILADVFSNLHACTRKYSSLKDKTYQEFYSIGQNTTCLLGALETLKRKIGSQNDSSVSLKRDVENLELVVKDKDTEILSMCKKLDLLYEACRRSIVEIENRKSQTVGNSFPLEGHDEGHIISYTDHSIEMMADSLLSIVKDSTNIADMAESNQRDLKASILDLQRGLQEKDIEIKKISEDLVSQIREAEALANRYAKDLDTSRKQVSGLEKKISAMENDKQLLELRISKLQNCDAASKELQDRLISLTDSLAAKDQEIDDLMQALDEEALKMEALESRNKELEDTVHEKILASENLETSREKALAKLSTTMSKFDELCKLSESLLAEIESLQSQLQTRDSEISFLRQEVTRCTNDALASQETNKKYFPETNELLAWMEMILSRFGEPCVVTEDKNCSQIHVYTDVLDKKISSLLNELEDLRVTAQSREVLLQTERGRVEELLRKTEDLETMHNKEKPPQEERDSVQPASLNSIGPFDIEQMVQRNKVSSPPVMTHIRSGRKVNNDQIAIAIDMDKDDNRLDDEDDDKAHGFKSLTMSSLVPRAARPISDRIDGIWVSVERLLMRQPSLRLGVIIYWVVLHALLASFI